MEELGIAYISRTNIETEALQLSESDRNRDWDFQNLAPIAKT